MNIEQINTILTKAQTDKLATRISSKKYYHKNRINILEKRKHVKDDFVLLVQEAELALKEQDNIIKTPVSEIDCIELIRNHVKNVRTMNTYIIHIKRFFVLTCHENDLIQCLKHYQAICDIIAKGQYGDKQVYGVSSIRGVFQICLFVMDNFLKDYFTKEEFDTIHDYILTFYNKSSADVERQTEIKAENEFVPTLEQYIQLASDKFGPESEQVLIAMLYSNFTVRDDFKIRILASESHIENDNENYVIYEINQPFIFIINKYKTQNKYNQLKFTLSKSPSHVLLDWHLRNYMTQKGKRNGDYLFGKSGLSFRVAKTNKILGFANGGINLFRHMRASEHFGDEFNYMDRENLASEMGHSISTQKQYKRNLIIT